MQTLFFNHANMQDIHTDTKSNDVVFECPKSRSASFSCENSYIDSSLLDNLFGVSKSNKYKMQYYVGRQVQAKQNKKKRINKKWLKRYGYKTVYDLVEMDIENPDITNDINNQYNIELQADKISNFHIVKTGLKEVPEN
jgi:hypothetical protein